MGANDRSRWTLRIAAAFGVVLLGCLLVLLAGEPRDGRDPPRPATTTAEPAGVSPSGSSAARLDPPPRGASTHGGDAAEAESNSMEEGEPPGATEIAYPVDLEALRARMPDNLYWKLGAPTKDPEALARRAEEERRWNELFGKVQSNTASEEEIRLYYDHRREVSEDFIEFASVVLETYGDKLPERDRGLYALSIKMHRSRLGEIPRAIEDALARKKVQDERRQDRRPR